MTAYGFGMPNPYGHAMACPSTAGPARSPAESETTAETKEWIRI